MKQPLLLLLLAFTLLLAACNNVTGVESTGTAAATILSPTDIPAPSPTPADSLLQGLAAYYPFDGNANDESGNGNDGIVNGATLTADRFGHADSAYQFDGIDDTIEILPSQSISVNQEATLSLWLYYEAQATSDYYSLAEKGDPERDGHSRWGLWIRDDVAELCIEPNEPNPIQRCLDGTVGLVPDGWNHVAGTYEGATLRLTINGALAGEQKGSPALIAQSNHNLQLGADLYQARPVYLKCILDDIRIYRRALADEEIVQLFDVQP